MKTPFNLSIVAVAMLCAATHLAFAQDQKNTVNTEAAEVAESSQPSQVSARKAYVDPKTGELRSAPPTSDSRDTINDRRIDISKLKPTQMIKHSNGMTQINLNGNGWSSNEVSIGCDGQLVSKHAGHEGVDETSCGDEK